MNNLKSAINYVQKAVAITLTDHSNQPRLLNNLSSLLSDRYHRFENMNDLEAAIGHAKEAVTTTLTDHPARPK